MLPLAERRGKFMSHEPLRNEENATWAQADCFVESTDLGREDLSSYGRLCFQLLIEREVSAT